VPNVVAASAKLAAFTREILRAYPSKCEEGEAGEASSAVGRRVYKWRSNMYVSRGAHPLCADLERSILSVGNNPVSHSLFKVLLRDFPTVGAVHRIKLRRTTF
jgi:predicted heme/steroid binding protein